MLITVDEEIGLLGAFGLDCSVLSGKRMINMDSEAEGSLWISCAGGLSAVSQHSGEDESQAEGEEDRSQDLRTDGWTFRSRD